MVPQPRAAVPKPQVRTAPARARRRTPAKRWPLAWSILSALAASALLWAAIYWLVSSAAVLIGGLLSTG